MRPLRIAVLIIGLFQPLVIQAQPFGTTELEVFDVDFLTAPEGPLTEGPVEPPLPRWISIVPDPVPVPWVLPPLLLSETPL